MIFSATDYTDIYSEFLKQQKTKKSQLYATTNLITKREDKP